MTVIELPTHPAVDVNALQEALAQGEACEEQQRVAAFFLTVFAGGYDWQGAKDLYTRLHGAKVLNDKRG